MTARTATRTAGEGEATPVDRQSGRVAALGPEHRGQAGPRGDQRPDPDPDEQGAEPLGAAGGDGLEREVGRQVVEHVGAAGGHPGQAEQGQRPLAGAGEPAGHRRQAVLVGELHQEEERPHGHDEQPRHQLQVEQVPSPDEAGEHHRPARDPGHHRHPARQRQGRAQGQAGEGGDHDGRPRTRQRCRLVVLPAGEGEGAPVQHREHRDGDEHGDQARQRHQRDVLRGAQVEVAQREQVGEVGDRQEERGGVGEQHRGHREEHGVDPQPYGDRQHHRGEQHGGGVEGEHRGAGDGDRHQPDPDAAYRPVRGVHHAVGDQVEEAQAGAQLGEHRREHEEQEDRADPRHQVGCHDGAGYAGGSTTTVSAWQQRRQRWSSPGGARSGCPPRTG